MRALMYADWSIIRKTFLRYLIVTIIVMTPVVAMGNADGEFSAGVAVASMLVAMITIYLAIGLFSADEAMNERRDELIDWLIPTLLMMDLSTKSAPDLAPTPTPAPEVLSELRLEGLYTPGDDLSQSPLLWLGADLDEFGYPETAPQRQAGDPIRVLVADYSEIIGIDKVGMEDMDRQYSAQINNRVNDLLKRFFAGEELAGQFLLVTDPAQADVILTITTSYPFAGNYGPTGAVKVYHCYVDVWIWHVGTDDTASFTYQREAENTITASIGATVVWKSLPDEFDNEVGRTILTWFPDA